MTKTMSFFNRLITFLVAVLCILLALVPIAEYWEIPYLSDGVRQLNRSQLSNVPYENWFINALIGATIALGILGLWVLLANIRSRAFSNREIMPADPEHGETVINVQRVSDAACDMLKGVDEVHNATSRVAMVGQRPTSTFTITANPSYPLEDIVRVVEAADQDFRMANHTMEIDTVWKLQLDRVPS